MTTYTDEVNIYNPDAISDAIDDAGNAYKSVITEVGSTGVKIHPSGQSGSGIVDYTLIDDDGMEVFEGGDSVAKFGTTGIRIGDASGNHTLIDENSFDIYYDTVPMVHMGYGEGNAASGSANAPYYTLGTRIIGGSTYSPTSTYTKGDTVSYQQKGYVCVEDITTPEEWNSSHWRQVNGNYSMTIGDTVLASGLCSYGEGYNVRAFGAYSHAEGVGTRAGYNAHAEGSSTLAYGNYSHAEGVRSKASMICAHAEGMDTIAGSNYSHAQNIGTKAYSSGQTAIGKYNIADDRSTYAVIVGNGTSDSARSNALAVTWDGSAILQGWAGIIQMFAGATPPSGWLLCDGAAVSRTTYAALFAAIGTTWGAGDGSTTFNLPDLRGRAPIGAGTGSGLTARTLGGKLGSENIQAHTHSFTQPTITAKYANDNTVGGSGRRYVQSGTQTSTTLATASGGAVGAVSGASTGSAGNMQPSAVVNFIIHTGKTG